MAFQRRAQLVAHIGQEFALGLVGALGADLLGLVLAGQLGQFGLAALQAVDRLLQRLLVQAARLVLVLAGGDVDGGHHAAAVGGAVFGDLHPAPVVELGLAIARAAVGGVLLGA